MLAALLALQVPASSAAIADVTVPIELRNASGLPRYVVGAFSIGGVVQHATFDAGNPEMPIFMAQGCRGCETGCPATVPQCAAASSPFCSPSAPGEYAPSGSYMNTSARCPAGVRSAGKLDGVAVCMQCFGGASHSRFYTMASADVTLHTADSTVVLPALTFGALVRTAPSIDRIWANCGCAPIPCPSSAATTQPLLNAAAGSLRSVGYGAVFLQQLGVSALRFSLRAHQASSLTLNPAPASYSSLPSAPFTVSANR